MKCKWDQQYYRNNLEFSKLIFKKSRLFANSIMLHLISNKLLTPDLMTTEDTSRCNMCGGHIVGVAKMHSSSDMHLY